MNAEHYRVPASTNLVTFSLVILSFAVIIIQFWLRHRLAGKPSTQTTASERGGVHLIRACASDTDDGKHGH